MKTNNNNNTQAVKSESLTNLINSNSAFKKAFTEFYGLFKAVKVVNEFAEESKEFKSSFEALGVKFPFSADKLFNLVTCTPYAIQEEKDGKKNAVYKLPKFSSNKEVYYTTVNAKGYPIDKYLPILNFEDVSKFSIENIYSLLENAYIHKSQEKDVKDRSVQSKLQERQGKFVSNWCAAYATQLVRDGGKIETEQIGKDTKLLRGKYADLFGMDKIVPLIELSYNEQREAIVKAEAEEKAAKKRAAVAKRKATMARKKREAAQAAKASKRKGTAEAKATEVKATEEAKEVKAA